MTAGETSAARFPQAPVLKVKGKVLQTSKTLVMGVVNLTPDSFFPQSRFDGNIEETVSRIGRMFDEGADIVDIGAESTRPGSLPVSEEEETARLMPIVEMCAKKFPDGILSVDTTKAAVARRALEGGARMINDISGLAFEPEIAGIVAEAGGAIVLSHTSGRPDVMQSRTEYGCVVRDVADCLKLSAQKAIEAGVGEESIVIDPGIGFGKTFRQNLEILNRLDEFAALPHPVLVGTSRKSFIGEALGGLPSEERLEGTAATVAVAVMKGASVVRVHDVREMARVARVADAIKNRMAA